MANCDFGSPCECSECRTIYKKIICPMCKTAHDLAIIRESKWSVDRKGIGSYNFIEPEITTEQSKCIKCKRN